MLVKFLVDGFYPWSRPCRLKYPYPKGGSDGMPMEQWTQAKRVGMDVPPVGGWPSEAKVNYDKRGHAAYGEAGE